MDKSIPQVFFFFWGGGSIFCDHIKCYSYSESLGSSWSFLLEKHKFQITAVRGLPTKKSHPPPVPFPHIMLPFPAASLKSDLMEVTSAAASAEWLRWRWQRGEMWTGWHSGPLSLLPWRAPLIHPHLVLPHRVARVNVRRLFTQLIMAGDNATLSKIDSGWEGVSCQPAGGGNGVDGLRLPSPGTC